MNRSLRKQFKVTQNKTTCISKKKKAKDTLLLKVLCLQQHDNVRNFELLQRSPLNVSPSHYFFFSPTKKEKIKILFVAKNISVTSAYYFRNDWKDSQSQSGYVHGIINLEKPLQLLLDIPLFVIFSKPSKRSRNMFQNILLLELFILIWLSQKNIFWSIKWPLKVFGKKWEKKNEKDFFLQHLQVFFLKTKLISTSPSFLHKKSFITCAKYFFKKRDMNRFVPKNKSVSRERAERMDETSDTQFSCLPQNYSWT